MCMKVKIEAVVIANKGQEKVVIFVCPRPLNSYNVLAKLSGVSFTLPCAKLIVSEHFVQ